MKKKITKVLIANRGEIAVRVIRACKELGLQTVSVHSVADENSLHVKVADESVCIGPASPKLSYLNALSVLSAAEITGADAIHPGYGFLSENSSFAKMCKDCGVTFIGPDHKIIKQMGHKIEAKKIAESANVPVLQTVEVKEYSKKLEQECQKLGYPLLIKAAMGGGGRGMRKVLSPSQLQETINILKEESKNNFGDDTLFIEKYIQQPRHIEVQVICDQYGNVSHLGERDCTVQRRYQKVLEEAPSPVISDEKRSELINSALMLCKKVRYDSVGTVEFLYDMKTQEFFFMEMNTRIQVEHPVSEELYSFDLIREQIRISMGEELSDDLKNVSPKGHVIELRINAEDPIHFKPRPGKITHYHRPGGPGIRVDDFIYTDYLVGPHYDSMISKLIVKAKDRETCIRRALRALDEMVVEGIQTNIPAHKKILNSSAFLSSEYDTNFINNLESSS